MAKDAPAAGQSRALNQIDVPATKIHPPQLAEDVLARPDLINELHQSVTRKRLTLLSAPAGAGKTTAVLAMLKAHPELQFAWISLDEGDDEIQGFLSLLVAGIQVLAPECGRQTEQLVGSKLPVARLGASLVNEMAAKLDGPFIIVLEDLHRVASTEIQGLLDYLLERASENIRFVVTSRHDPPLRLAQLRSQGQMAEIRLHRLQLNEEEIHQWLNEVMGFQISSADLKLVRERTEGWLAGLRLLSLSLNQLESANLRAKLIGDLAHSHRLLFDYLMEEVLSHLEVKHRDFLVQTSVLDDLTPERCNAVTGRSDSAELLETLYRHNLFLTLTDAERQASTYRYHALFRQFLLKQLRQDPALDARALHLRAAQAEPIIDHRIDHLLQAEAWDQAVAEIVAIGRQQCDQSYIPARTVAWIEQLPNKARTSDYWLDLIVASRAGQMGQTRQSSQLSEKLLPIAEKNHDTAAIIEALWNIAFHAREDLEHKAWRRLDALLLEQNDQLFSPRRVRYLMGKAWGALGQTDWEQAQKYLDGFYKSFDQIKEMGLELYQNLGPQWLFADDGIARVQSFDDRILREVGEDTEGVMQAGPFTRRAWIAFLQCDLGSAKASLRRAQRSAQGLGSFSFLDVSIDMLALNLMLAQAEYAQLIQLAEARKSELRQVASYHDTLPSYWFSMWRAYWSQGQLEEAAGAMQGFMDAQSALDYADSPTIGILRGWEAFANGKMADAEAEFIEAFRIHRRLRWVGTFGNAGIDLALFYFFQAEEEKAMAVWDQVASELKTRKMPGQALLAGHRVIPLLELAVKQDRGKKMASEALEAFGKPFTPHAIAIPGTAENLTPRESEVLRLLVQGASNQEIAEELVFTTRTAKAHVSHILSKLGVSSRMEAVARARELSLF